MPIHLRAEAGDYAPAVLCPGDPLRAQYIADTFFDPGFRQVNAERGMLGFTGTFEGRPILVRFLWSDITDSTCRWEQAFSTDDGATWEVNWIMESNRIA